MSDITTRTIALETGFPLTDYDADLVVMSEQDGAAGLTGTDVSLYLEKYGALPRIPGFLEEPERADAASFISTAARYADWKAEKLSLWVHFSQYDLNDEQAKELYQISFEAGEHTTADELVAIVSKPNIASLDVDDKLMTLYAYVTYREADRISEMEKLYIAPDFSDYVSTMLERIEGGVVGFECKPMCEGNVPVSGRCYTERHMMRIDPSTKNNLNWTKYIIAHEGYHYYTHLATGGRTTGDEHDVHGVSMRYIIHLTGARKLGETKGKDKSVDLFTLKEETYPVCSDIDDDGVVIEGGRLAEIRALLAGYPPDQAEVVMSIARQIDSVPTLREGHYYMDAPPDFFTACFEASLEEMMYEQGAYDALRDEMRALIYLNYLFPADSGMMNQLRVLIERNDKAGAKRYPDWEANKRFNLPTAPQLQGFWIRNTADHQGMLKDSELKGGGGITYFNLPTGQRFSAQALFNYYVTARLMGMEGEGFFQTVIRAWDQHAAYNPVPEMDI